MKHLFLIAGFFFSISFGFSQGTSLGVKAGFNITTITGSSTYVQGAKWHPAFHVGGIANFKVNSSFAIQPEILYSTKGVQFEVGYSRSAIRLSYIEVPLLLNYKISKVFFAEAGPQIGFLLSAKVKPGAGEPEDWKENLKSNEFSGIIGFGYKPDKELGASIRYDFGVANIAKTGVGTMKNQAVMISLIYTFSLR